MLTRILLLFAVAVQCLSTAGADDGALFENSIRPVLAERCIRCHGPNRQSGAVRLDEKQYVDRERLLRLVDGSSTAPDVCQLKLPERKSFADWIDAGLPWPESSPLEARGEADHDDHWAFQPVREPTVPDVANSDWGRTPIDAFVLRRLTEAGLTPSGQADRRTLVRRLYYSLTGLPPSADEVDQFVSDPTAEPSSTAIVRFRSHSRVPSRSPVSPKPQVRQPIVRSTVQRSIVVRTPSDQVLEKPGYGWANRRSASKERRYSRPVVFSTALAERQFNDCSCFSSSSVCGMGSSTDSSGFTPESAQPLNVRTNRNRRH